MQKSALSTIIHEELIRALVFGLGFFAVLSVGFVSVAYAANGGKFGEILNLILTGNIAGVAGKTWENPGDGTVANADKLDNKLPAEFVPVAANPANRSCGAGKCITGFQADGTVNCTP